MALDPAANFVRGTTDADVDDTQTTVSVDDASIFPDPSADGEFNVVIWDAANSPRPDQDADVEVLRVTAIDTGANDLTVVRGQEGTSGSSHPSGSAVHLSPTAKMFSDIDSQKLGDGENFDGQGTSEFTNLASVSTEKLNTPPTGGLLTMTTDQVIQSDTNTKLEFDFENQIFGNVSLLSDSNIVIPSGFDYIQITANIALADSAEVDVFRLAGDLSGAAGTQSRFGAEDVATQTINICFPWISVDAGEQTHIEIRHQLGTDTNIDRDSAKNYLGVRLL